MKTKLLISVILVTAVTAFIFNKPSVETNISLPPAPGSDGFIYGAIHTIDDGPDYTNYDDYLELGAWHTYVAGETGQFANDPTRWTPRGPWNAFWPQNDHLLEPVENYASDLTDIIDDIYSHNNSRILWQRPKIEWLAYGQSSNYQAENISNDHRLWFYSFQTHIGETQRDFQYNNGDSVLYCGIPTDGANAKFVLKGLKANTEQCRKEDGINDINQWHSDHQCMWYIKPRIRIPSNLPYENENLDVCKIKVIAQDGQTVLKETIIKAGYFKDNQHPYIGQYIENFFFPSGIDLIINGDWLGTDTESKWVLEARGNRPENEIYNHADIQVWWYDNCAMWIDYVKVENDIAYDLLADPPNPTTLQYRQWIEQETQIAMHIPAGASDPAVWKFYVEIVEFNNLPCINYLNERIRYHSLGKIDFIADFCERMFFHINWPSLPTVSSPQWIYDNYIQRGGFSAIYGGEAYAMTSRYYDPPHPTLTFSKIPETLPRTTCNSEPFCGLLAWPETPANYDIWLQNNFNHSPFWTETGIPQEPSLPSGNECYEWDLWQNAGKFRWVMKTFNDVSKIGNIPFIFMPQAHLWYTPGETEREPTNEELEMVANLAVSYGTRGLMWWAYGGFDDYQIPNCPKHHRGMTNPNNVLRTNNYYNQAKNKWEVFRDIGRKIRIWEPYLMSFNNQDRHSYIYYLERTDLINETYFKDVVTYKQGSGQPSCLNDDPGGSSPPGMVYECYEERYVQAAVFKQDGSNTPYFMLVNRRCSPISAGNPDGKRYIRIAFDANSPSFPVYRTWKILDIGNDRWSQTFDKTTGSLIDLGEFNPGEGRLYKVVPVLQSGGTLLNDEIITSGEEFTCEDTVWTNGYNLTIENGVTIHFSDSAKFVVEGGTFQIGDDEYSGPNNITMDATQGGSWKGFEFNGATVKIYGVNFSGLANDSISMLSMIDCPLIDLRNNSFSLGNFYF